MNVAQAKQIPIEEFLRAHGIEPEKRLSNGELLYKAPHRGENTASFKVTRDGKGWFDHGTGESGNILDLAHRMERQQAMIGYKLNGLDISGALKYIENRVGSGYNIPTIRQPLIQEPTGYVIEATRPLADRRGENWCRTRGLDIEACRPYLVDAYFNRLNKPYKRPLYGVGLPTITGGVEMRTQLDGGPWIKSTIGQKAITVFECEDPAARWYAFEGLPDFCTFLTIYRPDQEKSNFLILNGTGMTDAAIAYLKTKPPSYLVLCPQHGSQGSLASCERLRQATVNMDWDGADVDYPTDSYDLNAWFMAKKGMTPVVAKAVGPGLKTTPKLGL